MLSMSPCQTTTKTTATTTIIASVLRYLGALTHFGYRTTPILRMGENIYKVGSWHCALPTAHHMMSQQLIQPVAFGENICRCNIQRPRENTQGPKHVSPCAFRPLDFLRQSLLIVVVVLCFAPIGWVDWVAGVVVFTKWCLPRPPNAHPCKASK